MSKNNQVFAVSLSEIAFTLLFILMMLLGIMVLQERNAKEEIQLKLAASQQLVNAQAITAALTDAQARLERAVLKSGLADPQKLIEAVINNGKDAAERRLIEQEVRDLNKRLVVLEELRGEIEKVGQTAGQKLTRDQVERALEVQHQLRAQLKAKLLREVKPGEEAAIVKDIVEAAAIAEKMRKDPRGTEKSEVDRLQTQVSFYEKRDKLRGLDHPPCWMDPQSKAEFIFTVQTTSGGIVVTRGWPDRRDDEAHASIGFNLMTVKNGGPMNLGEFSQAAAPYLAYGKNQKPECRHFVFLSSTIADADKRDESRRLVNGFFYVLERKGS